MMPLGLWGGLWVLLSRSDCRRGVDLLWLLFLLNTFIVGFELLTYKSAES